MFEDFSHNVNEHITNKAVISLRAIPTYIHGPAPVVNKSRLNFSVICYLRPFLNFIILSRQ